MTQPEPQELEKKAPLLDENKLTKEADALARLFVGYSHYFHETIWLHRQKFFTHLCLSYADDTQERSIQKELASQKNAWQSGKQVHLGEILFEKNFIDEKQLSWICEEAGHRVLFCMNCKEYYHLGLWLPGKSIPCPRCQGTLVHQDCSGEILIQMLQSDFCAPRTLPDDLSKGAGNFVLLNLSDYVDMDMLKLDKEIQMIFEFLDQWIVTTLPLSKKQKAEWSEKVHQERLSQLALFFGHLYNLYELFWLMSQKMVEKLSLASHLLTPTQTYRIHTAQKKLLGVDKQCHWGDLLLHTHWTDEKQIYSLLQQIGNRFLTCKSCQRMFWEFMRKDALYFCDKCLKPLKESSPSDHTLRQSLRVLFSQPIALATATSASTNLFSFFAKRNHYDPLFTLSREEASEAMDAFLAPGKDATQGQEPFVPAPPECPLRDTLAEKSPLEDENLAEEKSSVIMFSGIGQTLDQLMDSIDKINANTPDEDLYQKYTTEKEKFHGKEVGEGAKTGEEKKFKDSLMGQERSEKSIASQEKSEKKPETKKAEEKPAEKENIPSRVEPPKLWPRSPKSMPKILSTVGVGEKTAQRRKKNSLMVTLLLVLFMGIASYFLVTTIFGNPLAKLWENFWGKQDPSEVKATSVYQKRWVQLQEDTDRIALLQDWGNLQNHEISLFFLEIVLDEQYSQAVRMEALNGVFKTASYSQNLQTIIEGLGRASAMGGELGERSSELAKYLQGG